MLNGTKWNKTDHWSVRQLKLAHYVINLIEWAVLYASYLNALLFSDSRAYSPLFLVVLVHGYKGSVELTGFLAIISGLGHRLVKDHSHA